MPLLHLQAVESSFLGASWQYCYVLKDASEDEMKMQDLAKELRDLGHKPAAETIDEIGRVHLDQYK